MANLPLILATIGDPDGTRTVTSIIALLVALGLALAMVAVWLYRNTRPDPELLGPLEVMGERRWRRSDPVAQRRRLDEARPADADPLVPRTEAPQLDAAFEAGPTAPGFDDLGDGTEAPDASDDFSLPIVPFAPPTDSDAATPRQLERPDFDDDRTIDPELLDAARAELDRELGHGADRS